MVYSVTGVTASPGLTFRSESRHTVQGAKELAATFIDSGFREVEIRDSEGNLQSLKDLEVKVKRESSAGSRELGLGTN